MGASLHHHHDHQHHQHHHHHHHHKHRHHHHHCRGKAESCCQAQGLVKLSHWCAPSYATDMRP
eukprot:135713-Karenia_brevis.AAC.1